MRNEHILVIDTECLRSADDCRVCGASEERHRLDFKGEYHRFTKLGWDNRAALGLSIGCAYAYKDKRCMFFDGFTLEAFVHHCVETRPLLVSFNGIQHDFRLLRALLRQDAANAVGRDDDRVSMLHALCDAFKALCATSYDLLAEIWQVDPARRFEPGLNSLDAIAQANGLGAKLSNGARAPRDWRDGQYARVVNYCQDDVYKTKALFELVCAGQPILRGDGQPITLRHPFPEEG